jgi:hypothetical protein
MGQSPTLQGARSWMRAPVARVGGRRRPPWLLSAVTYAVLLALCGLIAYWHIFSQFASYDDEGFFDYSLKLFLAGHHLYNSDFSDYGPFYYEMFGALFKITGTEVTTDAGRLTQMSIWVIASLGLGVSAQRLTGRLTLGVVGMTTGFLLMTDVANEPMHAEALICLLLVAIALVIAIGLPARPRPSLIAIGALVAALLLTKINVGGYAVVSILFAVVMGGRSLVRRPVIRWVAIILLLAVGPVVMNSEFASEVTRDYAGLAVLSCLSLVFVAAPPVGEVSGDGDSLRWLVWLLIGFAGAFVVIVGVIFALGTSPGALYQSIVVVPSHQSDLLYIPIIVQANTIWWTLAATAGAWVIRQSGWTREGASADRPTAAGWLVRGFAGVAILLSLAGQYPFDIAPDSLFTLAMPLAWVAALPSRRDRPGSSVRVVRLLIPSLAILQALLAFPVAGSQVALGSILLALCGIICLADAGSEFLAWVPTRVSTDPTPARDTAAPSAALRPRVAAAASSITALFVALAVGTTYQYVVEPLPLTRAGYAANVPVHHLHGAGLLRLPAAQAATLEQVSASIRAHCSTLIGLPGLYSFDLWSGVPSPSPMTGAQPWWKVLTADQRSDVLRAAVRSRRLCALLDPVDAASYGGTAPSSFPLVSFIEHDFKPVLSSDPYTVEVRRRVVGTGS